MSTESVLMEVRNERERQEAKWGQQNHPDGTGPNLVGAAAQLMLIGQQAVKRWVDGSASDGVLAYCQILVEEVVEALDESDPAKLRAELVQVAAVAVGWIEAIDRRSRKP